jgi:microcystin-dependent protein
MSEPYLGEIRTFGFNYAPLGWAFCNGATLSISQFSALYALLGTRFGGNGTSTFQLPNLSSRMLCGTGAGPGRTRRQLGAAFGEINVTLTPEEMPMHNHALLVYDSGSSKTAQPTNNEALSSADIATLYGPPSSPPVTMSPAMILPAGGNLAHENRQPMLSLNYCIALAGQYPSFP